MLRVLLFVAIVCASVCALDAAHVTLSPRAVRMIFSNATIYVATSALASSEQVAPVLTTQYICDEGRCNFNKAYNDVTFSVELQALGCKNTILVAVGMFTAVAAADLDAADGYLFVFGTRPLVYIANAAPPKDRRLLVTGITDVFKIHEYISTVRSFGIHDDLLGYIMMFVVGALVGCLSLLWGVICS